MSVKVLSAFLDESKSTWGSRLVGIVLSASAWDDGITWLPLEDVARRAGLSERQVYRCIRELENLGELEKRKAQRGRRRVNVYRLQIGASVPQYERLPFTLDDPFWTDDLTNRQVVDDLTSATRRPDKSDPDDLTNRAPTPSYARKRIVSTRNGRPGWKVDKQPVTALEDELARQILSEWNAQTGHELTSRDWLAKFVMRIREHPELELVDHARVIERALADPWWAGPATPSVVYGSGAQFERAILTSESSNDARASVQRALARAR